MKKKKFRKILVENIFKSKGLWIGLIFGILFLMLGQLKIIPRPIGDILSFPGIIIIKLMNPIIQSIYCTPQDFKSFGCLQAVGPLMISSLFLWIIFYAIIGLLIEKLILFLIRLNKRKLKT